MAYRGPIRSAFQEQGPHTSWSVYVLVWQALAEYAFTCVYGYFVSQGIESGNRQWRLSVVHVWTPCIIGTNLI